MERVCEMDVDRPPIARFPLNRTLTTDQLAFIRLKAPLVLYMLNKRMLKGGPSLGLNRVIPKMILSAMNGELGLSNAVSTTWFLRTCRKVSNMDLKTFTQEWIYPLMSILTYLNELFKCNVLICSLTIFA